MFKTVIRGVGSAAGNRFSIPGKMLYFAGFTGL